MKISIFPEVNPLPKSREEKHKESKKASHCEVRVANNDDQLFSLVTSYAWSPFIFSNNKRLASNFIETSFLVYDIDEGMSIEKASQIVELNKLCALILPSTSHTPEHHKFRIILPLSQTVSSVSVYEETWMKGSEIFGVVDIQCKDLARFFFSCRDDDGFWIEGDFFEPVQPKLELSQNVEYGQTSMINVTEDLDAVVQQIYGEKRDRIPEAVDFFLKNAHTGLDGKWTNSLNSFVFSLTLSGVDEELVWDICEQVAPSPLDGKDQYQIRRAIRDGKAAI